MSLPPRHGVIGIPGLWSSERLAEAVAERTGGPRLLIDPGRIVLDLAAGRATADGIDLGGLAGIFVKKIGRSYSPHLLDRLEMLRFLEASGVPFFSRPSRILRVMDRLAGTVSLRLAGIPLPPTVITEDPAEAAEAVAAFGRAVAKPLFTSKGRGMRTFTPGPRCRRQLAEFQAEGHPVLYLQKLLPSPGRDLGVAFIEGEYYATYARVGRGDSWLNSTSAGGRYERHEPPAELVELARRAQAPFGLSFTCVDLMETPAGPVVLEVSAFGGFRGLEEGCGLDAAREWVDRVLKQTSP